MVPLHSLHYLLFWVFAVKADPAVEKEFIGKLEGEIAPD